MLQCDVWAWNMEQVLELGALYLSNEESWNGMVGGQFDISQREDGIYEIIDHHIIFQMQIQET